MSDITAEKLASVYSKIKAKRSELSQQDSKLKEQEELVAHELLEICKAQGLNSLKTKFGTISRVINDRYWVNDWQPFAEYVKEHDALHLLQRRVSESAMKEWLADHPNDYPPALNCDRAYSIRFTKPRKELE